MKTHSVCGHFFSCIFLGAMIFLFASNCNSYKNARVVSGGGHRLNAILIEPLPIPNDYSGKVKFWHLTYPKKCSDSPETIMSLTYENGRLKAFEKQGDRQSACQFLVENDSKVVNGGEFCEASLKEKLTAEALNTRFQSSISFAQFESACRKATY